MLAKLTGDPAFYLTDGAGGELLVRRHLRMRVAGIRTAPRLLHAGVHIHGGGGGRKVGRLLGTTALHPTKGGLLGRRRDAVLFLHVVIQGADEKTKKIRVKFRNLNEGWNFYREPDADIFGPSGSGSVSQSYGSKSEYGSF